MFALSSASSRPRRREGVKAYYVKMSYCADVLNYHPFIQSFGIRQKWLHLRQHTYENKWYELNVLFFTRHVYFVV